MCSPGATKAVELLNGLGVRITGMQHLLLVKVCLRNLLAKHGLSNTDSKEEGEGKEEGNERETDEGEDNVQAKEEGADITETKDEGADIKEDIVMEDLLPSLELCKTSLILSEDFGSRGYYFINGKLLSLVCMLHVLECVSLHDVMVSPHQNLVQLSSQMISQLESEGVLPDKVLSMCM